MTATGSRFATEVDLPCAFVLSERGKVKYTSRSRTLRELGGWIKPGTPLPPTSISARKDADQRDAEEIAADLWFNDWKKGGLLLEEARHLSRFNQTLTLLWFDEGDEPQRPNSDHENDDDDGGLKGLDGILPWPGKSHRRR